jgi:hypothetical protein
MLPVKSIEDAYLLALSESREACVQLMLAPWPIKPLVKIFDEKMKALNEAKQRLAQTPSKLLEEIQKVTLSSAAGLVIQREYRS